MALIIVILVAIIAVGIGVYVYNREKKKSSLVEEAIAPPNPNLVVDRTDGSVMGSLGASDTPVLPTDSHYRIMEIEASTSENVGSVISSLFEPNPTPKPDGDSFAIVLNQLHGSYNKLTIPPIIDIASQTLMGFRDSVVQLTTGDVGIADDQEDPTDEIRAAVESAALPGDPVAFPPSFPNLESYTRFIDSLRANPFTLNQLRTLIRLERMNQGFLKELARLAPHIDEISRREGSNIFTEPDPGVNALPLFFKYQDIFEKIGRPLRVSRPFTMVNPRFYTSVRPTPVVLYVTASGGNTVISSAYTGNPVLLNPQN